MWTDIGNSITVDRHIARVRRFTGAIVDQAIANNQFVGFPRGIDGGCGQRRDRESHRRNSV
jgi:hypothetical protein